MKQTDSEHLSVRGWGCYLCSLAWIAGVRDIAIVDRLFRPLIKSGAIRDNGRPVGSTGWYRCYIQLPAYIIETFARELGHDVDAKEINRYTSNPEPSRVQPGMFIIKDTGKHFGVVYPEVYNPDPSIPLDGPGKTWRLWRVS
jgi:hypothetical protein